MDLVSGGDSGVTGKLYLVGGYGHVHVSGQIYGLKPGLHGFHVHMDGNLDNDCKAAGGHFNPDKVKRVLRMSLSRTKLHASV